MQVCSVCMYFQCEEDWQNGENVSELSSIYLRRKELLELGSFVEERRVRNGQEGHIEQWKPDPSYVLCSLEDQRSVLTVKEGKPKK